MKAKFTLLILFICATFNSFCQQYRSTESIGSESVSVIEFSANGDVWVGTKGKGARHHQTSGLVDYYDSTNSNLKSNNVTSIITAYTGSAQHAYIGTTYGVADIINGSLRMFGPLADSNVVGLVYRRDSLWTISTTGLTRFDSNDAHIQALALPFTPATAAQIGNNQCGVFCIGTANNGCYHTADGVNFEYINTGAPFHLVSDHVNAAIVDNSCSRKLIGTTGGFSICPPTPGPPCINFTTANGLPENDITSVIQCKEQIFLGTRSSGLVIYNMIDSTFTRVTMADGLTSDSVTAIGADTSCASYIGLANGDVAVLDAAHNITGLLSAIKKVAEGDYSVHVFPQPAKNQLNFVFENQLDNAELNILDVSGRLVQHISIKGASTTIIDVSEMAGGIYFYQLVSAGQQLKAWKVSIIK